MSIVKQIVDKYSSFITKYPFFIFGIVVLVFILSMNFSSNIGIKSMDNKDSLPSDIDIMHAFEIIEDSFGGSDSIMIAIEVNPTSLNSDEPRDIADYNIIQYISLLTKASEHVDDVASVNSASSILREMNNGVLPKSNIKINEFISANPVLNSYISKDRTMALVKISLSDDYFDEEIVKELEKLIDEIPSPSGLDVNVAGTVAANPVVNKQIQPDMAKTSNFSMIGIVIILLLVFRSLRFGLTPLTVIIVGITWAFGYMGLMSMSISSASSGAVSMIMGIGIDFGIQIVMRYRHELKTHNYRNAMRLTLNAVFVPMSTTTLSALIGFKAMSMGRLTFLAELGTIMSYGVAACFLAAITVIPSILIITEIVMEKLKANKGNKKVKKGKKRKKRRLKNPIKIMNNIIGLFK